MARDTYVNAAHGFAERVVFQRVQPMRWIAYYNKPNRSYVLVVELSDRLNDQFMVTVTCDATGEEWIAENDYIAPRNAARAGLRIMDKWDEEQDHDAKQSNVVPLRKDTA